jgi:hypothetical protein
MLICATGHASNYCQGIDLACFEPISVGADMVIAIGA